MKKLYFFAAAALVAMGAVSCVDKNYDVNDLNTDTTVDIEIRTEEAPISPADEIKTYDEGEAVVTESKNEKGETEITVSSPETETVEVPQAQVEQLNQGGEVPLPAACDMTVKIPISKKFPKDDIFTAMENPHFKIKVKNELGTPLKYTATITNAKGNKKFNIEAEIPYKDGKDVIVEVSEKGNIPHEQAELEEFVFVDAQVKLDPGDEFTAIFKDSPEELKISDAKVSKVVPKSGVAPMDTAGELGFSAISVFPFIVRNGKPFTMCVEYDLSGADFSEFLAITAIEADILVRHKLPLDISLELVEPADIFVDCPLITANTDEVERTQELTVKATCPTGSKPFAKAVIDATFTLRGNKQTYPLNGESTTISVDVKRNAQGKQMVRVTGRLGDK